MDPEEQEQARRFGLGDADGWKKGVAQFKSKTRSCSGDNKQPLNFLDHEHSLMPPPTCKTQSRFYTKQVPIVNRVTGPPSTVTSFSQISSSTCTPRPTSSSHPSSTSTPKTVMVSHLYDNLAMPFTTVCSVPISSQTAEGRRHKKIHGTFSEICFEYIFS
jgi:hypothetical protein